MGLAETKRNPAVQGRGMAMAGMIIGYVITSLTIAYFILVFVILTSMGHQAKDVFKTINAQLNAAQATNSADQSVPHDQATNAPNQIPVPAATNSPDQSTNSAPATTTPAQSTNSAPAATNSPDSSTNSSTPSTNALASSTNAAPMNP